MAKMKTLLIQVADYENEINETLAKAKKVTGPALALIRNDTLSKNLDRNFWKRFTEDENVIALILGCIQMNLITENYTVNRSKLTAVLTPP